MNRFLTLLAIAAVAGVMYVAAAPGGLRTAGPSAKQFAALKKEVVALKKEVGQVKTAAGADTAFIAGCLLSANAGVAPVTQFGDPAGTYGFQYKATSNAPLTSRTALDIDASANPGGYLQGVDPSCVSPGNGAAAHTLRSGSGHLLFRAERPR